MRFLPVLLLTALLVPALLIGFTNAPPANTTGAPGQNNCTSCHGGAANNSGPATFAIGAPASVAPGATVPITVSITGSSMPKHGFALTARGSGGTFLGTWQITDPTNTQTVGSQDVGHKSAGTNQSSWSVDWTAPGALSGPVTFYAAGLQGNGGGSSGDFSYTTSAVSQVAQPPTPMSLAVTSTNFDLAITLTGATMGGAPSQVGHEYWVLPTLNPAPGPILGLSFDALTYTILFSQPVLPGLHSVFGPSGNAAVTFPPNTLVSVAGMPMNFAAFAIDQAFNLSDFTSVVTITP